MEHKKWLMPRKKLKSGNAPNFKSIWVFLHPFFRKKGRWRSYIHFSKLRKLRKFWLWNPYNGIPMLILATRQSFMNTFSKCLQHRKEKNEISLSGDAQELFPPNFGQLRQYNYMKSCIFSSFFTLNQWFDKMVSCRNNYHVGT